MGYGEMLSEMRDEIYDAENPSGNRAAADMPANLGCGGEFCPDGTCRVCRYSGALVDW